MAHAELVAGDGGSKLVVTILNSVTKETFDLTGKTVQLRYAVNGGATVEKTMTPRNQATHRGQAEYQFLTTDLTVGGTLKGEARLQDGQSDQLTTVDEFFLTIKEPLP